MSEKGEGREPRGREWCGGNGIWGAVGWGRCVGVVGGDGQQRDESGRALLEAEERFAREIPDGGVSVIGVDLVDFFAGRPQSSRLRLVTASAVRSYYDW
ncbi:hypothetical protein ACIA5E_09565 [Nocardia asteroides]|uniref:hypothetical protein n=1 Tax=Nocardia asteroides TaxID=1824 RepID=UPI003794903C